MSAGYNHGTVSRSAQTTALKIALILNATYMLVEVVGGLAFKSLALLADAVHMFSDVAGLAIALIAFKLLQRPRSAKHSYGMQRAEVLGALLNGAFLLAVVIWVVVEAIRRLQNPEPIGGVGLLVVAVIGLGINLGSAVLLARKQGGSLNMRGAFIHMVADAAGSVAAIIAGLAVIFWGANWVDPAASLAIAALIVWSTYGLLKDILHVLLEGTPKGIDPAKVEAALTSQPGVKSVHHLHIWSLASDTPALSAHVVLEGKVNLHVAQLKCDELKRVLHDEFGIEHITLEMECHDCEIVLESAHPITKPER